MIKDLVNNLKISSTLKINEISKGIVEFIVTKYLRPRENTKEIWLAFSPIKSNYFNFMIQKATELGVTRFIPIIFATLVFSLLTTLAAFLVSYFAFLASLVVSLLLISKVPTYSLKKITVQRKMTIFLLFSIVLFFGLLLVYPFKVMIISGLIYLCIIPISLIHYIKLNKKFKTLNTQEETHEDVL